mmetsp:Transcript_58952/g.86417  ORF Transcript_58952/g.86417 Transcript_58952/m.86417 type:complete len:234 (+) Transcript_58952:184-885(+)
MSSSMLDPPNDTDDATIERARRFDSASLSKSSMEESIDIYLSLSLRIRSILKASIERSHAANERPSVCLCQFPMSLDKSTSRVRISRSFRACSAPPRGALCVCVDSAATFACSCCSCVCKRRTSSSFPATCLFIDAPPPLDTGGGAAVRSISRCNSSICVCTDPLSRCSCSSCRSFSSTRRITSCVCACTPLAWLPTIFSSSSCAERCWCRWSRVRLTVSIDCCSSWRSPMSV